MAPLAEALIAATDSWLAASDSSLAALERLLAASQALPAELLEVKLVPVALLQLAEQRSYFACFALPAGRKAAPVAMLVEPARTAESVVLPESPPFAAMQKTG